MGLVDMDPEDTADWTSNGEALAALESWAAYGEAMATAEAWIGAGRRAIVAGSVVILAGITARALYRQAFDAGRTAR